MFQIISTNRFPDTPWWQEIYLDDNGNYNVVTFKYQTMKDDQIIFLDPAGEPG